MNDYKRQLSASDFKDRVRFEWESMNISDAFGIQGHGYTVKDVICEDTFESVTEEMIQKWIKEDIDIEEFDSIDIEKEAELILEELYQEDY